MKSVVEALAFEWEPTPAQAGGPQMDLARGAWPGGVGHPSRRFPAGGLGSVRGLPPCVSALQFAESEPRFRPFGRAI